MPKMSKLPFDITKTCEKLLESSVKDYYFSKTFQRHLDDLSGPKTLDPNKYRFNEKLANAYLIFISDLRHYKGSKFAGQRIKLEPWQIASFGILFGWQKKNSEGKWVRRFNTANFFIARKNGKSLIASAIILADIFVLQEPGAEMVIGATKTEQAQIVWEGVYQMIQSHPVLSKKFSKRGNNLYLKSDISTTIKPLSRDAGKTFDGANIQLGVLDELAAHSTTEVLDVIKSSQGARENPMLLFISTAGFNLQSPMYLEVEHSKRVLEGSIEDNDYFCFIAKPDSNLDVFGKDKELAIRQANPNVDVSVSLDYLLKEAEEASNRPEKKVNYLTKHLNMFVSSSEEAISIEDWNYCKTDKKLFDFSQAKRCFIGLDLSVTDDFTAICRLWLFPDNQMYAEWKYIIPNDDIRARAKNLRVPLDSWVSQGYIKTSDSKSINLDFVTDELFDWIQEPTKLGIETELFYDPYKAKSVIAKLENEKGFFDHKHVYQGYQTMSEPTARLVSFVKNHEISIEDNPVSDWMVSNVSLVYDQYGNFKPDKSDRYKKIDGIAALIDSIYGVIPYLDDNEVNEIIWI